MFRGIKVIEWKYHTKYYKGMELRFLSSAHRLIMHYICTKFRKNVSYDFRRDGADAISIPTFTKSHNFVQM